MTADNTAPSVGIISHVEIEQVTGDIILRGTADDGTGSGLDKVQYQVGNDSTWTDVDGTYSWRIEFTEEAEGKITTIDSYANTPHAVETPPGSGIWRLPIQIRAIDKIGNSGKTTWSFDIDPDGDKPIVEVLYPDSGSTLGGTIRVFGSATDNTRVESVWMMIDVNGEEEFDEESATYLRNNGYTVLGTGTPEDPYQFKVDGTASWSMALNKIKEFNPAPEVTEAKPFSFRVRAKDENGLYGNWSEVRTISVDNNAPQIGSANPLKLVQYDSNNNIIAERDYIAGMYIRGEWYLVGSVWDESGIVEIDVSGSANKKLSAGSSEWFIQDGIPSGASYNNYQLRIPVGKPLAETTAGSLSYVISVEDASTPTGTATSTVLINYDNKAPESADILHGGQKLDTTNLIEQSNRHFTIESEVTEADSGFERLVFYLVRAGKIFNPMVPQTHANNSTPISGIVSTSSDGVPLYRIETVDRTGGLDTLSHDAIKNNGNIRVGGLVRIAGVDRVIQSVNHTSGVVTFSPGVETTHTTADFVLGLVVNNTTKETGEWAGDNLTGIINDDGDGMIESVERTGGNYYWTASFDSKNIPDGPIELRYVAFDKAGNSVNGSVETFVSNNRPKIAKVYLGTDLDGNGSFTSNELVRYYNATDGEEESIVNLASQNFKIKGQFGVFTEIVGGNGNLGSIWTTNGDPDDAWVSGYPTSAITGTTAALSDVNVGGTIGTLKGVLIDVSSLTDMSDRVKLFSITFWDETQETTQGTNSQWALLNAPARVEVVDIVPPIAAIRPFYWNSSSDNSLYENSRANGHIELEADLPALFDQAIGLFDADPKVSGKISIRGTAYDDQCLTALWMYVGDTAAAGNFDFPPTAITKTFGGKTYYRMAIYTPGSGWTPTASDMTTNGWVFSADDEYLDQNGHLVSWQLDWDTAGLDTIAAVDRYVRIVAEDKRATPNASSEVANSTGDVTTNNVPYYRMDVVPYIRTIGSVLSNIKKNNPSVYNRTALGRYPVNEDETITVSGFNLGGDQSVSMGGQPSGPFTLTVNSITTLNNDNNNSVEYNQLPNGDNNPHLTDDVILDVWQLNSTAVHSVDGKINEPVMKINPNNGIAGFAFANGVDSFSMANGTTNSYTHWQRNYADYGEVAFGFDVQGRSHGIVIGHDTEPNSGYTGRMNYITSRWGVPLNDARDNFRWNNKLRMESCGLPVGAQLQGEAVTQRIIDTTRFQSTSLAVASSAARTNPTLYLAYYDSLQEQIRFRWGTNNMGTRDVGNNGFNQFYDVDSANGRNSNTNNAYGEHIIFEPDAQYYSLIAGAENNSLNPTGNTAGEYVAIDVITGADADADIVTIVWYDGANLMYTYRYGTKDDTNASSAGVLGQWSKPITIFEEAGLDCAISVDANGGVHIAAYDRVEGALRYAYLSSHNVGQDDVQTCIVDDYNIVGNKITITTVLDDNNDAIPYISYYAPSAQKPKLAYLVDPAGEKAPDGVNENTEFTGAWEITTIPTGSNVSEDRINVDLWRDSNNRATTSSTGTSSSDATSGTVYGNGTNNPLAAYVINEGRRGYIETAQKK